MAEIGQPQIVDEVVWIGKQAHLAHNFCLTLSSGYKVQGSEEFH
jgi:hypothetical protein